MCSVTYMEEMQTQPLEYLAMYIYRLYCESVKIRDLDSRGPWAVASERSEDATKGPRLSKSRIFIGRAV